LDNAPRHTDRRIDDPAGNETRADPKYLLEHERGAKPGVKYNPKRMAMQAAPDHGDHE
jgi:hypothetical protein